MNTNDTKKAKANIIFIIQFRHLQILIPNPDKDKTQICKKANKVNVSNVVYLKTIFSKAITSFVYP